MISIKKTFFPIPTIILFCTVSNKEQINGGGIRMKLSKINQIKSNQIKSNQIKSNQIKSNQIKSNQIKSNQIKSNQT